MLKMVNAVLMVTSPYPGIVMNGLFKFVISLIPWDFYSYVMSTSLTLETTFSIWWLPLISHYPASFRYAILDFFNKWNNKLFSCIKGKFSLILFKFCYFSHALL
ncbi:hypothetical protein CKY02_18650 [Photorhabdus bodei]|uniref:Uncharacterized protein n=1 Tax=Photorhabdus bodei TaxID=2029681 RepID=A0A329WX55_9GAMM|nr:hypothetical protein CKY02_18650 [Photorhabdus bodei]